MGPGKTNMRHIFHSNPRMPLILDIPNKVIHHVANIIAGGISERGLSKVARRIYVKHVFMENVISPYFPENIVRMTGVNIFSPKRMPYASILTTMIL